LWGYDPLTRSSPTELFNFTYHVWFVHLCLLEWVIGGGSESVLLVRHGIQSGRLRCQIRYALAWLLLWLTVQVWSILRPRVSLLLRRIHWCGWM
jgi:hypothetical protein